MPAGTEHFTFIFDEKQKLVGAAVFSDDADLWSDILPDPAVH